MKKNNRYFKKNKWKFYNWKVTKIENLLNSLEHSKVEDELREFDLKNREKDWENKAKPRPEI